MSGERMKGHLDLLLMSVLSHGPAHGYAVITALAERSGGEFDLPEGTIYPALHRLERRGLVSSEWSTEGGRRRRVYGLTATGHTELVSERREWDGFRRGMVGVLGT